MTRPVTVISTLDQIASRLRSEVRRGVFQPGDPLREAHLAARFGVSRSPIRQVLQQLTFEGLLQAKPNCGTIVAEPPTAEVAKALYECRAKLECIALRQCFADLDHGDFERWREILNEMYECCDREDHSGAFFQDSLFHRVIVDKASPAGSLGVYSAIAGATSEYLNIDKNRPFHADFRELYGMHAALYEMIRLGDAEVACEALSQHILKQEFVAASCRRWTEAGKPREYEGVYDSLAQALRRAVKRRREG
jgi:DNA-binding GntR family transcriptional regulator